MIKADENKVNIYSSSSPFGRTAFPGKICFYPTLIRIYPWQMPFRGASAPIKLKKAILSFFIVSRLDNLINPAEERSIAMKRLT